MTTIICIVSCLLLLAVSTVNSAGSTPNIIFMLLDDLGYADLTATYAEYNTPNLDELFESSIELRSHYIGLMCSVSRMQILTGRYAWNMGLSSFTPIGYEELSTLPAGIPTIAELLKQYTEYDTYAIGKWQEGYITWESTPTYRGFDHFYGFYGNGIFYTNKTYGNGGHQYIDWRSDISVDYDTQFEYSTYSSRDRLLNIINDHPDGADGVKPYYVYAALQAPHADLQYVESDEMESCKDIKDDDDRYLYCLNVVAVDQLYGEMVEALKDNGVWDDTLIIFTSDNGGLYKGGACNYPYRGNKQEFFEGGINTLALVGGGYIPQDQQGWKRGGFMHGVDWTPTLLSLAGVDVNMVNHDLLNNHYKPILDKINSNNNDNNNNNGTKKEEEKELSTIANGFDGVDLSRWLIYGNEGDNNRSDCPLSINDWNDTVNTGAEIAIVFVSLLTNHKYKLIHGEQRGGDWCEYCFDKRTGIPYRCQVDGDGFELDFLFDLTLDLNETINLLTPQPPYMISKEKNNKNDKNSNETKIVNNNKNNYNNNNVINIVNNNNNNNNKGDRNNREVLKQKLIEINNKTEEYKIKQKLNLLDRLSSSSSSLSGDGNVLEISDIFDYFLYKDSDVIIEEIWSEGYQRTLEYQDNDMYNPYSDCQLNQFKSQANPANLDGAWGPWFTFDEYTTKFKHYCGDYLNDVLVELYTTQYDESS